MAKASKRLTPSVKQELKKHVAVVHVAAPFGLLERKVYNFLLLQAYDDLPRNCTHEMPLQLLLSLLRWEHSKNVDDLRDAIARIVSTEVQFNLLKDDKLGPRWEATTMMSYGSIQGGVVSWRYDAAMAAKLYDPSVYATISVTVQHELTSTFSWALYEQCVRFRKTHWTGVWSIDLFRQLVGASASTYDEFKYLSQRVIAPAVAEINKVTDICIEPKFERTGRRITGVNFRVDETRQPSLLAVNMDNVELTAPESQAMERMHRLGIKPKLAMNLVRQYEENHLEQTLRYIESELREGRVKSSAGGYLLTMLRQPTAPKSVRTLPAAAVPTVQPAAAMAIRSEEGTRRSSPMSLEMQQKIDSLTRNERVKLAREFVLAHPEASRHFDDEEGTFSNKVTRFSFKNWLFGRLRRSDSEQESEPTE